MALQSSESEVIHSKEHFAPYEGTVISPLIVANTHSVMPNMPWRTKKQPKRQDAAAPSVKRKQVSIRTILPALLALFG